MTTTSILTRLEEVEAEEQYSPPLFSSARKDRISGQPRRQTVFIHNPPDISRPITVYDKVNKWLDRPAQIAPGSPLLDFFLKHDRHHVILDNIYQRLNIEDVLAVSRTCKALASFYNNMLPCHWNINRRLARFVNDPKEFRSQLGQADALISGTFALLFFAQLYWLDSGLDIYVRQGPKADALIEYIASNKSYELDFSYGWADDDQHRTLTKVLIFQRVASPKSPQIRFHLTILSPLHSILTDCAWSTAHVNVITWNKAYCVFSYLTFIEHRMYYLHEPDETLSPTLDGYSANGWHTPDWIDHDPLEGCKKPGVREGCRRLGDSSTWTIPLNLHEIRAPETPDSVLESCVFQICPDSGPREPSRAGAGTERLKKTFSISAPVSSTPQPLSISQSKVQITSSQARVGSVSPPPIPLRRARGMTTSRLSSRLMSPLESVCEVLPLSVRSFTAAPAIPPRAISTDRRNTSEAVSTKPKSLLGQGRRVVSDQDHSSARHKRSGMTAMSGDMVTFNSAPQSGELARSVTISTSVQHATAAEPSFHKVEDLLLKRRRPKERMLPPPLTLTTKESWPLIPDLLTPPPDTPLPATIAKGQLNEKLFDVHEETNWI
ncbi:hypothetical protein E4T39_04217 [Aureobasidium subglaciale]|nr:hypothetical protein E4T39_04217 [Aureobasidium subglaciale]